jgi:hypothetical protein
MKRTPLESEIQSAICDYLAAKRHFFWRQNTAPSFDWKSNQFRRMPKHALKGVPDIILVHVGRPYFLEVKRPKTYQSPEQKLFQQNAEAAGALYAVVRSIDDVQALGL